MTSNNHINVIKVLLQKLEFLKQIKIEQPFNKKINAT